MASIAEWIQKIKTAIYGEEVRGAIWRSLQAMNDELTSADVTQIPKNKQDIAGLKTDVTNLKASDTELKDIRVGADGTRYETAGEAVRTQIADLKSDLNALIKRNSWDFIKTLAPLYNPTVSNGITYNVSEDNIITTNNATSVGNSYYIWFNTSNSLLPLMEYNTLYRYVFKTTYNNMIFSIYGYKSGGSLEPIVNDTRTIGTREGSFTISNTYVGLLIRSQLTVGQTVNNDVFSLEIVNAETDSELEQELSSFKSTGGADKYIKNLRVYTTEPMEVACINIKNNYSDVTGFALVTVVNGSVSEVLYDEPMENSSFNRVMFKNSKGFAEFYFDASAIASGSRDISFNDAYIVKDSHITRKRFTEYADFSMFENFGVIGDSYASGEIYTPTGEDNYHAEDYYDLSWGQILARMCGNTCTNFSKGGLTTETWLTDSMGLSLLQSESGKQLYICALGLNDASKNGTSYIGASSDISEQNNTFYGNYGKIINAIKTKNPSARIILFTIPNVTWISSSTIEAYNTAIITIALYFGIPSMDINADDYYKSNFFYTRMVQNHPVSIGYSGMAKANKRIIESLMNTNRGYFSDYIGS